MKPILRDVQNALIRFLQEQAALPQTDILPCGWNTFDQLRLKQKSKLKSSQLWVSYPFPQQTAQHLSNLYWTQIAVTLSLIRKYTHQSDSLLAYEAAEQVSFVLSHKTFNTPQWSLRLELDSKQPWQEVSNEAPWQNLQLNFISTHFTLNFL